MTWKSYFAAKLTPVGRIKMAAERYLASLILELEVCSRVISGKHKIPRGGDGPAGVESTTTEIAIATKAMT